MSRGHPEHVAIALSGSQTARMLRVLRSDRRLSSCRAGFQAIEDQPQHVLRGGVLVFRSRCSGGIAGGFRRSSAGCRASACSGGMPWPRPAATSSGWVKRLATSTSARWLSAEFMLASTATALTASFGIVQRREHRSLARGAGRRACSTSGSTRPADRAPRPPAAAASSKSTNSCGASVANCSSCQRKACSSCGRANALAIGSAAASRSACSK